MTGINRQERRDGGDKSANQCPPPFHRAVKQSTLVQTGSSEPNPRIQTFGNPGDPHLDVICHYFKMQTSYQDVGWATVTLFTAARMADAD